VDELDELEAAIRGIVGITSRGRERVLLALMAAAREGDRDLVAELALEYAEYQRREDGYRKLVQRPGGDRWS
jgi:hypothetical protein